MLFAEVRGHASSIWVLLYMGASNMSDLSASKQPGSRFQTRGQPAQLQHRTDMQEFPYEVVVVVEI